MQRSKLWLLSIALGVILSLTNCKLLPGGPEDALMPISTAVITPTRAPASSAPPFAKSAGGLEKLKSYRYLYLWERKIEGSDAGTGVNKFEGEYVAPDKERITLTDLKTGEGYEAIRIGDKTWLRVKGETQWMEVPLRYTEAMLQGAGFSGPLLAWKGLHEGQPKATFVGEEIVNSIPCFHYTLSSGESGIESKGEAWVATEGYPVKYTLTVSWGDREGRHHSSRWSMEHRDINQPISIEPPT